jgi:hypothetical protein
MGAGGARGECTGAVAWSAGSLGTSSGGDGGDGETLSFLVDNILVDND